MVHMNACMHAAVLAMHICCLIHAWESAWDKLTIYLARESPGMRLPCSLMHAKLVSYTVHILQSGKCI